jgi:hypothetical protein
MYIGVAQELVDRISETNSPMDTVTSINELIRLMRFNPMGLIEGLEKARDNYCSEQNICNFCGSNDFKERKVYENSDADGNRGIWITYLICKNCGTDINNY